mmetsp:Transcript_15679/g.34077  ORF Transcript_15679/g.34077 Transcript_15679/m.34077 type:complete len:308 (-) Transcript_15679:1238-2161(-)
MKIVELLPVDEEIKHVVPLPTDLQTNFDPIQFSALEEFGRLETSEEVLSVFTRHRTRMELIQHPRLEHLLVRNSNLGGVVEIARYTLLVPMGNKGHVNDTPSPTGTEVEGTRRMIQSHSSRCVGRGERSIQQERTQRRGRNHFIILFPQVILVVAIVTVPVTTIVLGPNVGLVVIGLTHQREVGLLIKLIRSIIISVLRLIHPKDRIQNRAVRSEARNFHPVDVAIFIVTDVAKGRMAVAGGTDLAGPAVENLRVGDSVLGTDGEADDDLVNVVELIPILLILILHVTKERVELGPAGDGNVESLGG